MAISSFSAGGDYHLLPGNDDGASSDESSADKTPSPAPAPEPQPSTSPEPEPQPQPQPAAYQKPESHSPGGARSARSFAEQERADGAVSRATPRTGERMNRSGLTSSGGTRSVHSRSPQRYAAAAQRRCVPSPPVSSPCARMRRFTPLSPLRVLRSRVAERYVARGGSASPTVLRRHAGQQQELAAKAEEMVRQKMSLFQPPRRSSSGLATPTTSAVRGYIHYTQSSPYTRAGPTGHYTPGSPVSRRGSPTRLAPMSNSHHNSAGQGQSENPVSIIR